MISKNPEQRQQYEARMKFQRDEAARLQMARSEGLEQGIEKGRDEGLREGMEKGIEKGIEKGVLLGRIALLQELLGIVEPTQDELSNFDESRLSELAEQLKNLLRSRGT